MVADEGKDILHKLYPLSFSAPSEFSDYPFKFSNKSICTRGGGYNLAHSPVIYGMK